MTAALINIVTAPATAELTGAPGLPSGPVDTASPGEPQSFSAAMQKLDNPHGDGDSSALLPADLTVAETGSVVATNGPVVPASLPDLNLPGLTDIPITETQLSESSIETVSIDEQTGSLLPDTGAQAGNMLPLIAGQTEPGPLAPSESAAKPVMAGEVALRQATIDPMQMALTKTTSRSIVLKGQAKPDADATTTTATATSTMAMTDDPPALTLPKNTAPGSTLQNDSSGSGHVQQAFELMMHNGSAAANRASSTVDMTMMTADSGVSGFSQLATHTPALSSQLTDLPQFQNMRPLQPMADPQAFSQGLGQRLMVMSEEGVQSAHLKLHPEKLGALDVRIRVEDDTARILFTAHHGQAREALEAALPKLRELFAQQGMNLVQADVGSGHDRHRSSEAFDHIDDLFPRMADDETGFINEPVGRPNIMAMSNRALDIYV